MSPSLLPPAAAADLLRAGRPSRGRPGGDIIALGPAVPISRRCTWASRSASARTSAPALARGGFDVVHGFELGLPSLSYLALREARGLAPSRPSCRLYWLGYPQLKAQRGKLLARVDALPATSAETAEAAAERFPGDYTVVTPGSRRGALPPGAEGAADRPPRAAADAPRGLVLLGAPVRTSCPAGRSTILRTKPLTWWPYVPNAMPACPRPPLRTGRDGAHPGAASAPDGLDLRPVRARSPPARPARGGRSGRRYRRPGRGSQSSPSSRPPSSPGSRRTRGFPPRSEQGGRRLEGGRGPELRRRSQASSRKLYERLVRRRRSAASGRRFPRSALQIATGIVCPTSTCTRPGRHDCSIGLSRSCSTTRRPRASARSRSPTTTSSGGRRRRSSSRGVATSS